LRPHVWRKRGIGKELLLVSNVDAVTKAKIIVVKLERRLSDKIRDRLFHVVQRAAQSFIICAPRTSACAERFATTPAILDLRRTRDNAPHITEG